MKILMTIRGGALAIAFAFALLASGPTGCSTGSGGEPPASAPANGMGRQAYVRDLGPAEFHDALLSRPDAFVLDVRQYPEWNDDLGHLERAVQIPLEELDRRASELPADRDLPIFVYCRVGLRSASAAQILTREGYREVVTLLGGLAAYRQAGY